MELSKISIEDLVKELTSRHEAIIVLRFEKLGDTPTVNVTFAEDMPQEVVKTMITAAARGYGC